MDFSNGLLGLGGFGGMNAQSPGLLSKYYDPEMARKMQMKQGLLGAGIALLSQQPRVGAPYGFGESLGTALRGGVEGAQNAQQDYMNNAMMAYEMDRKAQDDAWQEKSRTRQEHAWDDEDQKKKAHEAFISALPEDQRALAEAYPQQFGDLYMQQAFPKPADPTDDMREYNAALKQGFSGTFMDYQKEIKGGGGNWTTVTTNDGVFAVDAKDPTQRFKIGDRPDRNEGEGREFAQESKLRDGYIKESKPFADLRTNYSRIKASAQDNTGASDIAMVYSFMKMLDPTSVVREGEFATAENAGGIPQQIQTMYNRAIDGQRLSPDVRKQFMQQADRQYEAQFKTYKQIQKTYQGLAGQYNLDPSKVAPDLEYGVAPGGGAPEVSPLQSPIGNDPLGLR